MNINQIKITNEIIEAIKELTDNDCLYNKEGKEILRLRPDIKKLSDIENHLDNMAHEIYKWFFDNNMRSTGAKFLSEFNDLQDFIESNTGLSDWRLKQ